MSTDDRIQNLDVADWIPHPWRTSGPRKSVIPGPELRSRIREVIGMGSILPRACGVRVHRSWVQADHVGTELSWDASIGGPRTGAWMFRPRGSGQVLLPAVLLLHGHDGVKFYGRHKVANGPGPVPARVAALRDRSYDGLVVASELVSAGFAVLVHDVFPWGSRRVPWEQMPPRARTAARGPDPYESASREFEHGLMKRAVLAGSSLAAISAHEDLVALGVVRELAGVDRTRVAALGFSGGGARAAHLVVCGADLAAVVIAAMTSTFSDVRTGHADDTTWLMTTPGLSSVCDWPDVISSAAPLPLLVQFAARDSHFGFDGMVNAEAAIAAGYAAVGSEGSFESRWYNSGHRFTGPMQHDAASWLMKMLG